MKVFIEYTEQNIKEKAYTSYELDHKVYFMKYNCISYMFDRNNGPSYLCYYNHILIRETYYENDKLHRLNGPAWINYETNEFKYWVNGKEYKNEFEYWIAVGNYKKEKKTNESIC